MKKNYPLVVWIKSDLTWRKLHAVGAAIYGFSQKYSADGTFYMILPRENRIMKARFYGDSKDSDFRWLDNVDLEKKGETIVEFINSANLPCFILDNSNTTYEILKEAGVPSINIDFVLSRDDFREAAPEEYKLITNRVVHCLLSVKKARKSKNINDNDFKEEMEND